MSTFGPDAVPQFAVPAFIFTADASANHALLRHAAQASGGAFFDLTAADDAAVLAGIGDAPLAFLSAAAEGEAVSDLLPAEPQPVGRRFTLVGRLAGEQAKVLIRYGAAGKELASRSFDVSAKDAPGGDLLQRFWAQRRVEQWMIEPQKNRQRIVELAQAYRLVTPFTSLIVLERLDQYVQYRIRPPASMPELRRQYDQQVGAQTELEEQAHQREIEWVQNEWQSHMAWWQGQRRANPEFRSGRLRPAAEMREELASHDAVGDVIASLRALSPPPPRPSRWVVRRSRRDSGFAGDDDDTVGGSSGFTGGTASQEDIGRIADDIIELLDKSIDPESWLEGSPTGGGSGRTVVTYNIHDLLLPEEHPQVPRDAGAAAGAPANGAQPKVTTPAPPKAQPQQGPSITLKPWQPQAAYLEELARFETGRAYRAYMQLRRQYADSPAFFLDCGEFFLKRGEQDTAVRVWSNIAELELEDAALLRVLAHRLAQAGRPRLAAELFERVLRMRPEEPQSYRDLALVLAELKQYGRAIELLNTVATRRWERFDGVGLVALEELNRLIPLARAAGVEPAGVDPKLISSCDADLRVVVTWDADQTAVNLWVFEPSGERADAGSRQTEIGGRILGVLREDGYGPQEYVIRHAQRGMYRLRVDYGGSSAPRLVGAVTVHVDIFTDYGRPTEKRQSLTLRLSPQRGRHTVANVRF
jgi:Ca-activated chloride channel family protein